MRFDTVKTNLEKEGKSLLEKLRTLLNDTFTDECRSCLSHSFYEAVRQYKDELVIAESVALHEQRPTNETCIWYEDYQKYIKLKEVVSTHKKEEFEEFEEDLEDFDGELVELKKNLYGIVLLEV